MCLNKSILFIGSFCLICNITRKARSYEFKKLDNTNNLHCVLKLDGRNNFIFINDGKSLTLYNEGSYQIIGNKLILNSNTNFDTTFISINSEQYKLLNSVYQYNIFNNDTFIFNKKKITLIDKKYNIYYHLYKVKK